MKKQQKKTHLVPREPHQVRVVLKDSYNVKRLEVQYQHTVITLGLKKKIV